MTYALNGKENYRKRCLLPSRNGLCLLTILNNIKPSLHVYENRSHLMSPAKEVLEEDALLVPASPGATVPASLSGEGGRRPGRSRSSRKQSAGTPPPPCSGSPGATHSMMASATLAPLLYYYLSWRTFQTGRVQQKALSIVTTGDLALDLFTSSVGRQDPAGGGSSSCSTIAYQLWPLWLLLISEIWTDNCNLHCLSQLHSADCGNMIQMYLNGRCEELWGAGSNVGGWKQRELI